MLIMNNEICRLIGVLLFGWLFSGCGNSSDSDNKEIALNGQMIQIYDDFTGDSPFFIINDTIVSSTIWPDYNFSISKLTGDSISLINYMVKKGAGPGESQLSMAACGHDGKF